MSPTSGDHPDRIVGRRAQMSRRQQRIQTVALVAYVVFVAWMATRGRWTFVVFYSFHVGLAFLARYRKPTMVDADCIHRRFPRRRVVPWAEVSGVAAPQPGHHGVRLNLTNGKTVTLEDIPATDSAAVAALGGTTVVKPERVSPAPRRPTQRSDRDIEIDVDRRARALAERSRELDAEYRRVQRHTPTPDAPPPSGGPT